MMIDSTGKEVKEVGNASAASGLDYHLGQKRLFYTDTEKRKDRAGGEDHNEERLIKKNEKCTKIDAEKTEKVE